MKILHQYHHIFLLFVFIGLLSLTGCADNDYDLGSLDTTMAVGSNEGFQLPANSTHIIRLSDLIELEEGGVIKLDENEGFYYFYQEGEEIDAGEPKVDRINLADRKVTTYPVTVSGIDQASILVDFPGMVDKEIELPTPLSIDHHLSMFTFQTAQNPAVVELDTVETSGRFSLRVQFNDKLCNAIRQIDTIRIKMPYYLKISPRKMPANATWDAEAHQFVFTEVYPRRGLELEGDIKGMTDFQEQVPEGDQESYLVSNSESVMLKGFVDISMLVKKIYLRTAADAYDDMTLKGTLAMDDAISILYATGKFNPSITIDDFSYIQINDVPDFLNDPSVHLEIANPELRVSVESDVDLDGFFDLTMTSEFTDQPAKSVSVNDIKVHRNGTTNILISNKEVDEPAYDQYTKDLRGLLSRIPHRIKMVVGGRIDKTKSGRILLGHTYTFKPSKYQFYAPLALTDNSRIVYKDTINGWMKDLKDLDLHFDPQNHPYVLLTAKLHNGLPYRLSVSGTAVGVNSSALNGMQVTVTTDHPNNEIAASGVTNITIRVEQTAMDAFKKLDGLTLRAEAVPQGNDDAPLSSIEKEDFYKDKSIDELIAARAQVLKMDDLRVRLVGKVIVSKDK